MKKLVLFAFVIFGFAASSYAQVTGTAASSATIITPIAISNSVDLSFGNIAVSTTAGTVLLTPGVTATRTPSGGVTLPVVTGTVTAAKFTVTGLAGSTYSISLPTSDITLLSSGNSMTVGSFTSTPSPSGVLTGGTQDVYVGATLNVNAAQAAGLYTNAAGLFVTVNYN